MSRARPIAGLWFDTQRNNEKASAIQLETLAQIEGIELDDLLDEGLTQGKVLERLRLALDGQVIPEWVLEARRASREAARTADKCRFCIALGTECEGSITRHHFVPRWMMLELENYQSYAARSKCCIPACVGRHRDLHLRGDTDTPKSIVEYLRPGEAALAQKMLDDLREQKPAMFDLILGGDEQSYEYQLLRDYKLGLFVEKSRESAAPASSNSSQATA